MRPDNLLFPSFDALPPNPEEHKEDEELEFLVNRPDGLGLDDLVLETDTEDPHREETTTNNVNSSALQQDIIGNNGIILEPEYNQELHHNPQPDAVLPAHRQKPLITQEQIDKWHNCSISFILNKITPIKMIKLVALLLKIVEKSKIYNRWPPLSILVRWIDDLQFQYYSKYGINIFWNRRLQRAMRNSMIVWDRKEETRLTPNERRDFRRMINLLSKN